MPVARTGLPSLLKMDDSAAVPPSASPIGMPCRLAGPGPVYAPALKSRKASQNCAALRSPLLTAIAAIRAWLLPSKPYSIASASTSSIPPIAVSNTIPTAGLAVPGNCMSGEVQRFQPSRRISEMLHVHAHALHHRQIQIAHRRLPAIYDAPPCLEMAAAAPRNQRRQIFVQMAIAVGKARPVDDHAIVEQRPIAFPNGPHLGDPRRELPHMIAVDPCHLFDHVRLIPMMRQGMVTIRNIDLAVGPRGSFVGHQERDDPRQVR